MRTNETNEIIKAARRRMPRIVPVIELSGSDGGWYRANGFPASVVFTGEKRTVGHVFADRNGITYGQRYESEQAARDAFEARQAAQEAELRAELAAMSDDSFASQLEFWRKKAVAVA